MSMTFAAIPATNCDWDPHMRDARSRIQGVWLSERCAYCRAQNLTYWHQFRDGARLDGTSATIQFAKATHQVHGFVASQRHFDMPTFATAPEILRQMGKGLGEGRGGAHPIHSFVGVSC